MAWLWRFWILCCETIGLINIFRRLLEGGYCCCYNNRFSYVQAACSSSSSVDAAFNISWLFKAFIVLLGSDSLMYHSGINLGPGKGFILFFRSHLLFYLGARGSVPFMYFFKMNLRLMSIRIRLLPSPTLSWREFPILFDSNGPLWGLENLVNLLTSHNV